MIKRWTLGNFKSVYSETDLELSPITLFVGANSAGKSTFIQSMLLVAQTLQDQLTSRHVVLNGRMIRAGTFGSIISSGSECREVTIGFEIDPTRSVAQVPYTSLSSREFAYWRYVNNAVHLDCLMRFTSSAAPLTDARDLNTSMTECKVSYREPGQTEWTVAHVRKSKSTAVNSPIASSRLGGEWPPGLTDSGFDYEVLEPTELEDLARPDWEYGPIEGRIVGATLTHFVPTGLVVEYDENLDSAKKAVRGLLAGRPYRHSRIRPEALQSAIAAIGPKIIQAIKSAMEDSKTHAHGVDLYLRRFERYLRTPERESQSAMMRSFVSQPTMAAVLAQFESELVSHIASQGQETRSLGFVPLSAVANEMLRYTFVENLRYLGPLRDDPRAVYPFDGFVEPGSVGLRGEFTAAALEFYKMLPVSYAVPGGSASYPSAEIRTEPLEVAVSKWLQYLGVVHSVRTEDKGIFGHELTVSVSEGEPFHTLPHVGVGVSQVLPILVMSLLSSPGATLVLEQPELHLHPAVQARLADFFLSMSASGRQCIVETHSEYLVSRLRLRSAEDEEESISKSIRLYFVEKRDGHSHYSPGRISPTGAMSDWPDGFFDQSVSESREILSAAMRKRAGRGGHGAK